MRQRERGDVAGLLLPTTLIDCILGRYNNVLPQVTNQFLKVVVPIDVQDAFVVLPEVPKHCILFMTSI
jgi:hypothetical protein